MTGSGSPVISIVSGGNGSSAEGNGSGYGVNRHSPVRGISSEAMERLCQPFGVIERQRKLHLGLFVRAMVISAGTPGGAYQADGLRASLEFEVPPVARSAFYRWFDEPLEHFMETLAQRAQVYARAQQVDLVGPLCGVTDWYIVDATTVRVRSWARRIGPSSTCSSWPRVSSAASISGSSSASKWARASRTRGLRWRR